MKLDETKGGEQRMHEFAIKSSGKRRQGRERKKEGESDAKRDRERERERESRERLGAKTQAKSLK